MKKIFQKYQNRGFTLIESLVATIIMVIVIAAVSQAVQTGINTYLFASDQVTAIYLAEEGIEQIRYMRDVNGIQGANWLHNIAEVSTDPCYFGNKCIIDVTAASPTDSFARCTGTCENVRQNTATDATGGLYGHNTTWTSWSYSPYRREVELTSVNGHEVTITSTVYWTNGATTKNVQLKENILNWQS